MVGQVTPAPRPAPGSPGAVALGCLCAVIDNGHGAGCGRFADDGSPLYWIDEACPIHGERVER